MDLPQPLPSGNAWSVQMAEDGLTFERVQASPALPEVSSPPTAPPLTLWAWKPEAPQGARPSHVAGHLVAFPGPLARFSQLKLGGGGGCVHPRRGRKGQENIPEMGEKTNWPFVPYFPHDEATENRSFHLPPKDCMWNSIPPSPLPSDALLFGSQNTGCNPLIHSLIRLN